ncbi:hypothetical protein CN326_18400 [Bacillus sp. AFS018417]|uniref:FtsK/SpoIIIE domain-containing protein n=1 Tax=Bacillus sp. AFS018417 TaxID=2033491 RepID=UPI000BFAA0DB|nr:FtsK/SpoIIIE domain-containing protein [Bacillus sp. AFS018417]PEZ03301.1 hypothetical protein CN326_18400 [Bacillus sp. AFS018417]
MNKLLSELMLIYRELNDIENTHNQKTKKISDQYSSKKEKLMVNYLTKGQEHICWIEDFSIFIKQIEEEFIVLDKFYAKKKDRLKIKENYTYPYSQIKNPVEEIVKIANRLLEVGTDLLTNKPIFHFTTNNRTQKYTEIKFLFERANLIETNLKNEYLKKLTSNVKGQGKQLISKTYSQLWECHQIRRNELEERIPTEVIQDLMQTVEPHKPDFLLSGTRKLENPIINLGLMKAKFETLDQEEISGSVIEEMYGDWIEDDHFILPFALQFNGTCSIMIHSNRQVENKVNNGVLSIISRMLAQLPPTKLHCIFIDPKNAGRIFSPFMKLALKDDHVVGKQVFTSQEAIHRALDGIYNHIDNIMQFKLSSGFGDIYEYNSFAKENAESYKLLTVLDFPKNFSMDMMEKLLYIVENGSRCGVHTIITYNSEFVSQFQQDAFNHIFEKLGKLLLEVFNDNKNLYLFQSYPEILIEFFSPPQHVELQTFIEKLSEQIVTANKKGTPFSIIIPDLWFARKSSESLTIPLGKTGAGETHELLFGVDTSQHAIIAGKTGSGKTTLLHTLITSACINYSPDELQFYLLDFKEGVEFMEYANYKIPHMKLLALESEQEFGESILIELQTELSRRGTIFKEHGVQNIKDYRNKTGGKMPRILLIIDEFQVLFDSHLNSKIARNCGALIDDLVRRGRSFGIHIILASQSISSTANSTFEPTTRSQMAVRIGLKADEKDARILLGEDNNGIESLGQEMGVAIYNSDAGNAQNVKFKIAYLDKSSQEEVLQAIHNYSTENGHVYNARVFSSQTFENIEEANIPINDPLDLYQKKTKGIQLWMGKSNRVAPPYLTINLNYRNEDNMIILGQDEHLARKALFNTLCSVLFQYQASTSDTKTKKIIFADFPSPDKEEKDSLDELLEKLPSFIETVNNDNDFQMKLDYLHEEMNNRKHGIRSPKNLYFFFLHGIQRIHAAYDTTARVEDNQIDEIMSEFGFSNNSNEDSTEGYLTNISPNQKFLELLKDGPRYGIYVIAWCDTNSNFTDLSGYDPIRSFGHRIACRLRDDESTRFLGEEYATLLKKDSLIYKDLRGDYHKFQPFEYPSVSWIDSFVQKITHQVKS